MGIFLRQSHNVKPSRWGSFADVQYAIRVNSEKIYDCNPDDDVLVMPLFWGLPCLDYSKYGNNGTNLGSTFRDNGLYFDGIDDEITIDVVANDMTDVGTVSVLLRPITDATNRFFFSARAGAAGDRLYMSSQHGIFVVGWIESFNIDTGTNFLTNTQVNATVKWVGTSLYTYIDGAYQSTHIGTSTLDQITTADIGGLVNSVSYDFKGTIYEVRISKTARTADQIALFNDNKYGLYQKVSRPIWSIPAAGVTIPIFMQNMRGSFNSPGTRGGFIN